MIRINLIFLGSTICASFAASTFAMQQDSTVVFADKFDRTGEVGNEWKLNTKEDHQFVLRDGAVHITRNKRAKHSANMVHKAGFENGTLNLRFKLTNDSDSFRIQFRDDGFEQTKQGMLFIVELNDGKLMLRDSIVAYGIRQEMKLAKTATPSSEQQARLNEVTVSVPVKLSAGEWHSLMLNIESDKLTASIDDKERASLSADGIGHNPKVSFRLETQQSLVVDNISVTGKKLAQIK